MFRESENFKVRWDILIIVFAIYNSITIPLGIAFDPDGLNSIGFSIFDSTVDLVFFIDLFVNFRTTYINTENGEEIKDPKKVALKYFTGRFILDLLSTVPFDKLAGGNEVLPILGMLKLIRVFRISMVIRNLNIKSDSKASLRVLWLIFFLFLYLHVIACVWYFIVKDNEEWICHYDFVLGGTFYIYEFYSGDLIRRYLRSLYVAFYIISIGEMAPRTKLELAFTSVIMVSSSIMLSNIFGSMANLAREMNS
jgi:hypothetical protein